MILALPVLLLTVCQVNGAVGEVFFHIFALLRRDVVNLVVGLALEGLSRVEGEGIRRLNRNCRLGRGPLCFRCRLGCYHNEVYFI